MKKISILSMALLATVLVTGCKDEGGTQELTEEAAMALINYPKEIEGYQMVGKPKDGHEYIFGFYNYNEDKLRFVNGDYHRDAKGEYPYYMATTENTTVGAAKITVNYVNDTEFTMKVSTTDTTLPWNGCYMTVYKADSSYNNFVLSFDAVEDLDGIDDDVIYKFTYVVSYNTIPVCSPCIMLQDERLDEESVLPKPMGAGTDTRNETEYISLDCGSTSDFEKTYSNEYRIAHFYEYVGE